MKKDNSVRKYLVIAAVLQVVWGLVPSASKFVIDEIPVELYVALRWTISGGIFAVYLFLTTGWKSISPRNVFFISLLGILGYGFASFGTLYGLKIGGVTNFSLTHALGPIIVSAASIWILKERPHRLFFFALPIGILGLILLVIGKYQVSSFSIAGISALLILGAIALEALVFVFSKRFKASVNVVQYLTISQLATAAFMWLLQLSAFKQVDQLSNLTSKGVYAAIFVSVVACVLCYAVLYWLLNHVDGHRLALFDGFHALSATLFGIILFHETLKPLMIIGGALILSGLVLGNWPQKK